MKIWDATEAIGKLGLIKTLTKIENSEGTVFDILLLGHVLEENSENTGDPRFLITHYKMYTEYDRCAENFYVKADDPEDLSGDGIIIAKADYDPDIVKLLMNVSKEFEKNKQKKEAKVFKRLADSVINNDGIMGEISDHSTQSLKDFGLSEEFIEAHRKYWHEGNLRKQIIMVRKVLADA